MTPRETPARQFQSSSVLRGAHILAQRGRRRHTNLAFMFCGRSVCALAGRQIIAAVRADLDRNPQDSSSPRHFEMFSLTVRARGAIALRQHIDKALQAFKANTDIVTDEEWLDTFNASSSASSKRCHST